MGRVMGLEARAKYNTAQLSNQTAQAMHGLSFFSPNVNLYTHYTWGRGQASTSPAAPSAPRCSAASLLPSC